MTTHMVELEDADYQYLEKSANVAGISVQELIKDILSKQRNADNEVVSSHEKKKPLKSRWAKFSERIRKNPPLRGAGEYVRECSREFREDFAFKHDVE